MVDARRRIGWFVGAATFLVIGGGAASAQSSGAVETGSRVRVVLQPDRLAHAAQSQELRGRLTGMSADTLHLQIHDYVQPVAVPLGWVNEFYVSLGPESGWQAARRGFTTGFLLGAVLGAAVGGEVANTTDTSAGRAMLIRIAAYGVSLGTTAAAWQASRPGERWERRPVRNVVAMPTAAGLALGVSLAR